MAFSISCPHCPATLKTATAIAIDCRVTCPQCNNSFAVSEENMDEISDTKTGSPNRPIRNSGRDEWGDVDRSSTRPRDDDVFDDNRSTKKKRSKGGLITGMVIGGVIAVAGIVFLCFWMFGKEGYDEEMVAFMPSDTSSLEFWNLGAIEDSPKWKKTIERDFANNTFAFFREAGLTNSDVSRILKGTTESGVLVSVVRLKKSLDRTKVIEGVTEAKANNKSYYQLHVGVGDLFIHFATDKLVVQSSSEEVMKTLLNKDERKVVVSEQLLELAKKVDKGEVWQVHVIKNTSGGANALNPGMPEDEKDALKIILNAKGSATRIEVTSDTLKVTHYLLCADPESANRIMEYHKKMRDETKGRVDEVMDNLPATKNLTDAQKEAVKKMIINSDISKSERYFERSKSLDLKPFDDLEKIEGILGW